ncbi:MAG TPA: hypothetical protein VEI01_12085 [Terriglobales bacterium]|nr:hypothetical protein [Terriglobales bacterium]
MPYRNPERKRQWEQQHRVQRNARRRAQRLAARSAHRNVPKPLPDPVAGENQPGGWKVALGLAVGIGIILLGAMAGVDLPTGDLGQ